METRWLNETKNQSHRFTSNARTWIWVAQLHVQSHIHFCYYTPAQLPSALEVLTEHLLPHRGYWILTLSQGAYVHKLYSAVKLILPLPLAPWVSANLSSGSSSHKTSRSSALCSDCSSHHSALSSNITHFKRPSLTSLSRESGREATLTHYLIFPS